MTQKVLMVTAPSVLTNVSNALKIHQFVQNAEEIDSEMIVHVLKECMMMEHLNSVNHALVVVLSVQVHQELVLLA
jgi:hypothetical protein